MLKAIYKFIEGIALWCLRLLFKILHKEMTPKIEETFVEFVQFGIVGVSNTIVSYAIYAGTLYLLVQAGLFPSIDYLIANVVSFLLSVLWSFYWNNKYVFKLEEGEHRNLGKALFKTYVSYGFTGLILNNVLSYLWVGLLGINKLIAPIINLLLNVPINFVMNKLWAFKKK